MVMKKEDKDNQEELMDKETDMEDHKWISMIKMKCQEWMNSMIIKLKKCQKWMNIKIFRKKENMERKKDIKIEKEEKEEIFKKRKEEDGVIWKENYPSTKKNRDRNTGHQFSSYIKK